MDLTAESRFDQPPSVAADNRIVVEKLDRITPSRSVWLGHETMAIAAFVLLSLTVIRPINIGLAVAATFALIGARIVGSWGPNVAIRTQHSALAVAGILVGLAVAAGLGGPTVTSTTVLIAPVVVVVAIISLSGNHQGRGLRWLGASLMVAIVFAVGAVWILLVATPEIDVLDLHLSAAEVLADGGNPYAEARAPDTSPTADPGTDVVGYPYPPLTMIPYVAAQFLLGDPRWASVIAIAAAVLLMVRPWAAMGVRESAAVLAVSLAVVVQPVVGHIIKQGWTEPLALPLLAGVGLLWRKNPTMAAVLLGLTLGLKQYWIVALPLLFIWSDSFRWKRFWITGGVAALAVLPAFVVGPGAAWQALVVNLAEMPPRLDSIGFAGIGWDTPLWLLLGLSAAVAVWMGKRGGSASRFLVALAATLATAFLFGSQAFVNYWFLVGTLALIAVSIELSSDAPTVEAG